MKRGKTMSKLTAPAAAAIAVSTILAGGTAHADAVAGVLDHHVANMKSGNLSGVLSDYAPDAVVVSPAGMVSPSGVFTGKGIGKLFSVLTDKDHVPGNKTMQTKYDAVSPDTTIMHWVQFKGTKQEVSGYDVFVVRGGKVVFQTIVVNPPK
jgi:ketosteroid isomerase-like protein